MCICLPKHLCLFAKVLDYIAERILMCFYQGCYVAHGYCAAHKLRRFMLLLTSKCSEKVKSLLTEALLSFPIRTSPN